MHKDLQIGPFEEPVHLTTEAGELDIRSAREAAEMLLYAWPIGETGLRIQARMTCMKVLAGSEPPELARSAFVEAAKEAHILGVAYEEAH
ncbi:DUF982 domain-containing protein [Nitratireductor sp. GCM10026969]|uniref:DUF982 domain-containing protein n=1 Tax=Nitratireductor sp. GCM10026969 TaxID=3252645 RepID=UPI0036112D1C